MQEKINRKSTCIDTSLLHEDHFLFYAAGHFIFVASLYSASLEIVENRKDS